MPIIERSSDDAPLSQGDILGDIPLFRSKLTNDGIDSAKSNARLCLVLSRPCNLEHKDDVIVAEIHAYKQSVPKDVESFQDALDFLTTLRDGVEAPDRFYLGELPNESGRFVAMLDSHYTIHAPRKQDLVSHRVASLNHAFQRDLHVRLLTAFASLGFDDTDWLPTSDLELLKTVGESELARLKSTESEQLALQAKQQFGGQGKFSSKTLDQTQNAIKKIEDMMQPYLDRLAKRMS